MTMAKISLHCILKYNSQKWLIFNSKTFNYCTLIWMFCSRTSKNMINKIHERALRLTLNVSDFATLLQNDNDTCNPTETSKL